MCLRFSGSKAMQIMSFDACSARVAHPFSLLLLFSLALFSLMAGSAPRVEAETGDLVQNADFESGNLSSWVTYCAPGGSGNTRVTNDACCNHTPGGRWSGYIKPQTGFIEIYQIDPGKTPQCDSEKRWQLLWL